MTDPVSPKDPVVPHIEKAPAAPTAFETWCVRRVNRRRPSC